jgi:anti-sigma regulatory factor (Ser/Thr protein kinase)
MEHWGHSESDYEKMTLNTEEALLSIPQNSAAIGTARRFAAAFLRSHEQEELVDTVVLLVSEVVTNAILHGGSGAELRLILSGQALRAEVRDPSSALPAVKRYSVTATTGRGMMIVEALATSWGSEEDGTGKVVWFSVDAPTHVGEVILREGSSVTSTTFQPAAKVDPAQPAVSDEIEDEAQPGMVLVGAGC